MFHDIEVDIDNTVLLASEGKFPAGVTHGQVIVGVNGVNVGDRAELRQELRTCETKDMTVVKLTIEDHRSHDDEKEQDKDEFDLESNVDEDEHQDFIGVGSQASSSHQVQSLQSHQQSAKDALVEAARKTGPGRCIILMCDSYNPALHIEGAANEEGTSVMHIDAVSRVRTRQRMEEYGKLLTKSLQKGLWLYIENATKSISLLQKLADCIAEGLSDGTIHKNSRAFILCEPHPHFPSELLDESVTLRLKMAANDTKLLVEEKEDDSKARLQMLQGRRSDNLTESLVPQLNTGGKIKKRVRIAAEVDVVQLETSAFMEMSASALLADPQSGSQPPGLSRVNKYRFGPTEKLISLCRVGQDRFAVGTSSGYVVVLDRSGLPLIQYRPHKVCLWDVKFCSTYDFSTASEDGTSSIYRYHLDTQELEASSVASFQSDVFAVAYSNADDPGSAVLSGGLSATICVLHTDRASCSFVPTNTSVQAMCTLAGRNQVLYGGGNGACAIVDAETVTTVDTVTKHSRKVPAVSSYEYVALSGSFDKTLRVWDTRAALQCSHNLVMADVLTATAIDDNYIAACSGSTLYLWDLRNLHQVLAARNKAWQGLTRGLVIDSASKTLVTASVDGTARYWQFQ